ncbi:MAG: hypothetical protein ACK401_02275 [Archaeoglobaceae archaeon]
MVAENSEIERIVSLIKKEIENSEIARKMVDLDSKLVELRKSVESIVIELTYIKDELKELRGDKKRAVEHKREEAVPRVQQEKASGVQIEKKAPKMTEKMNGNKAELEQDDKDLIICD